MNIEDFDKFLKSTQEKEYDILVQKGKEYTISHPDKLANFKRNAELTGMSPLQVWSIFFMKHIDAICHYVKEGAIASDESIEGRFYDARNYLVLGLALIKESETTDGRN